MSYNTIAATVEDGVGHLQMTLHETKNATTDEQFVEITQCLRDFSENDDVVSVVLSGTEDYFCTGLNLKELQKNYENQTVAAHQKATGDCFQTFITFRKPLICALAGPVVGSGGDFAQFSDLRVASENMSIGFPQIQFGWIPYFNPLYRIVGVAKAKEMLWTGEFLNAEQALEIGLVNKVVPEGTVIEESMKMARKIAANGLKHMLLYKELTEFSLPMDTEGAFNYTQTIWRAVESDPKIAAQVQAVIGRLASKSG